MKKGQNIIFRMLAVVLAVLFIFGSLMHTYAAFADAQTDPQAAQPEAEEAPAEETAGTEDAAPEAEGTEDAAPEAEGTDAAAQADPGAEPVLLADKAVLIEAETGRVLYALNAEEAASPASMTKMMTGYLGIINGSLTDSVTMTQAGVDMAYSGSANLYTQVGEVFTLEQLLYGALVYSANDMATQIAEYIGGSVPDFVTMMNEKAAELGCMNTHFANACGYPDENNNASAHDIALIARAALENETFRTIIGTEKYVIPVTNLTNHDRVFETRILMKKDPAYLYDGVIGGKTGYTDIAGNCLAVFCERDGMTLIAVVMHAPSAQDAAQDAAKLFDYGYYNFEKRTLSQPDFPDYTGEAVMRKDVPEDMLSVSETLREDADGAVHVFEYYDGEELAGSVEVPEDVYQSWLDAQMESSEEEESSEPEITETPVVTQTPAPVEIRRKVEFPKNFSELMVWLGDGANRLLFILVILIILAFILAFVLWVKQLGRRRRRRKRRKKNR